MSWAPRSTTSSTGAVVDEEGAEGGRVDPDQVDTRARGALSGLLGHPVPGEDQPGARVAEVVADLPRLEQWVHRHDDPAGTEHAVVDGGEVREVRQHDGDFVARLDAPVLEQASDTRAALAELSERHHRVTEADRDPVGVRADRLDEVRREVHDGHQPLRIR